MPNGAGAEAGSTFVDATGVTTLGAEAVHLFLEVVGPEGEDCKLGDLEGNARLVGALQGRCQKDLEADGSCPAGATEPDIGFAVRFVDQPLRKAIIDPDRARPSSRAASRRRTVPDGCVGCASNAISSRRAPHHIL